MNVYLSMFCLQLCLTDFADETTASDIKKFFDTVNTPIVSRAVKQTVETILMRHQILHRDSKAIEEYLKSY